MGWVFLEPFNFLLMHSLYTRSLGHLPFPRTGGPEQPSHKENSTINQAPVVQMSNSAIHRINHYPVDSVIDFRNTYLLDSDLSGG